MSSSHASQGKKWEDLVIFSEVSILMERWSEIVIVKWYLGAGAFWFSLTPVNLNLTFSRPDVMWSNQADWSDFYLSFDGCTESYRCIVRELKHDSYDAENEPAQKLRNSIKFQISTARSRLSLLFLSPALYWWVHYGNQTDRRCSIFYLLQVNHSPRPLNILRARSQRTK